MTERSLLLPPHGPLTPVPASSDEGSNSDAADVPKRRHQHDTAIAAMQSTSPIAAFAFSAQTTPAAAHAHAHSGTPPSHKGLPGGMPQLIISPSHTLPPQTFVPFLQLPGVRPLLCASLLWIFLSHTPRGLLAAQDPWRSTGSCVFVGGFVCCIGFAALISLFAILAYPLLFSPARMQRGSHSVWAALRTSFELFFSGLPWVGAVASIVTMLATLGPRPDCWHDQPLREWAVLDAMAIAALCVLAAAYAFMRYPAASKILRATQSPHGGAHGAHGAPPASPLLSGRHELKSQRERLHRFAVELAGKLLTVRSHLRKYGRVWICAVALAMIGLHTMRQRSYHQVMLRHPHFTLLDRPAPCVPSCSGDEPKPLDRPRGRACVSGDMQRMSVHECLSAQPVRSHLPRHHEVFDACKHPAQCFYPTYAHSRYMWSQRHERVAGSSGRSSSLLAGFDSIPSHVHRCSLHDSRRHERVALSSEWLCWDDVKHQWADQWFCDGLHPPYCKTGLFNKHDVWHVSTVQTEHCTNPCEPLQAALDNWSRIWIAIVIVSAATWTLRWKAGLPLLGAQMAAAHAAQAREGPGGSSGSNGSGSNQHALVARPRAGSSPVIPGFSSPVSSAAATQLRLLPLFGLSMPSLSAEETSLLNDARTQLYRRLAHRWLLVRAGLYLRFTLVYGLRVMHRNVEYVLRWVALGALVALQVDATQWIVWLVDSPCTAFTALLFAQAAIIYTIGGALLLALLLHWQQPSALANLQAA